MEILTTILAVWTGLVDWFGEALAGVVPLFYTVEDGLTFIGVLTVLAIAFGVATKIIAMVRSYLQMRA